MPDTRNDSHVTRSDFGAWLDGMLRARQLNRQDFGRRLGVDPSMVSRWTIGRIPRPDACRLIAVALALPEAEVLERAGHILRTTDLNRSDPTRARLHVLVDTLDPALLAPHLAILERTLALVNARNNDA